MKSVTLITFGIIIGLLIVPGTLSRPSASHEGDKSKEKERSSEESPTKSSEDKEIDKAEEEDQPTSKESSESEEEESTSSEESDEAASPQLNTKVQLNPEVNHIAIDMLKAIKGQTPTTIQKLIDEVLTNVNEMPATVEVDIVHEIGSEPESPKEEKPKKAKKTVKFEPKQLSDVISKKAKEIVAETAYMEELPTHELMDDDTDIQDAEPRVVLG